MQIILMFLLIIIILILLLWFLLQKQSKQSIILKKVKIKSATKPKTQKKLLKTDEELFIAKEKIISNTERKKRERQKNQEHQQNQEHEEYQEKIVGIVKPQGYWTNRIFGERFSTILAMSKQSKTGFWTTLVELNRAGNAKNNNNRNR
jgi:FtsZ-interacting cell division protein ZipA